MSATAYGLCKQFGSCSSRARQSVCHQSVCVCLTLSFSRGASPTQRIVHDHGSHGIGMSSSLISALTNARCATPGRVHANGSLKGSRVGLLGVNCADASGHRRLGDAIGEPSVNRQFQGCRSLTRGAELPLMGSSAMLRSVPPKSSCSGSTSRCATHEVRDSEGGPIRTALRADRTSLLRPRPNFFHGWGPGVCRGVARSPAVEAVPSEVAAERALPRLPSSTRDVTEPRDSGRPARSEFGRLGPGSVLDCANSKSPQCGERSERERSSHCGRIP